MGELLNSREGYLEEGAFNLNVSLFLERKRLDLGDVLNNILFRTLIVKSHIFICISFLAARYLVVSSIEVIYHSNIMRLLKKIRK